MVSSSEPRARARLPTASAIAVAATLMMPLEQLHEDARQQLPQLLSTIMCSTSHDGASSAQTCLRPVSLAFATTLESLDASNSAALVATCCVRRRRERRQQPDQ